MKKFAVIVAGGSGTRMGGGIPKQFRSLAKRPVLWWSMKAFYDEDPATEQILVLPEEFITLWSDFFDSLPVSDRYPHKVASGGLTRGESVKNGLRLIKANLGNEDGKEKQEKILVAVHDGARPLVTTQMITEGWHTANEYDAAIPGVDVTDSLREKTDEEGNSHSVDRSRFVAVQTPQVFDARLLLKAYEKAAEKSFTDDAAVMEYAGHKVKLYKGHHRNLKITNPEDMALAETLLQKNV